VSQQLSNTMAKGVVRKLISWTFFIEWCSWSPSGYKNERNCTETSSGKSKGKQEPERDPQEGLRQPWPFLTS